LNRLARLADGNLDLVRDRTGMTHTWEQRQNGQQGQERRAHYRILSGQNIFDFGDRSSRRA
jgi:hypothetical protein